VPWGFGAVVLGGCGLWVVLVHCVWGFFLCAGGAGVVLSLCLGGLLVVGAGSVAGGVGFAGDSLGWLLLLVCVVCHCRGGSVVGVVSGVLLGCGVGFF